MKSREVRAFNFEVRAERDEEKGDYIVGRPIVYDSVTDIGKFREVIEKGALDGADLKDVPFFVNHNIDMIPLARSRNNNENSTMQLQVDDDGMVIRAELDTERNKDAKALYSAVERGDIEGMSFMFGDVVDEWSEMEEEKPLRTIKKLKKIFEVSAVSYPAYESTSLEARSMTDVLESAKASLESEKRQAERTVLIEKLKKVRGE